MSETKPFADMTSDDVNRALTEMFPKDTPVIYGSDVYGSDADGSDFIWWIEFPASPTPGEAFAHIAELAQKAKRAEEMERENAELRDQLAQSIPISELPSAEDLLNAAVDADMAAYEDKEHDMLKQSEQHEVRAEVLRALAARIDAVNTKGEERG